ncbi:IS481 family transposase [Shewanella cyperi]|uniref:IS481 family transposase n=1 Tax=Shewanella cyperi TaxID=2814292 RepID=UPI001A93E11E|nr:IS481 family transposase [Shewanella cyperi]QSX39641.1 IS481 family transposase [Shewanella cyperi]
MSDFEDADMPWNEVLVMTLRQEFTALASKPDSNVSALCRRFGISRKTGYKWLHRATDNDSMDDRSKRPKSSPAQTAHNIEALILDARLMHPEWGGRKLKRHLENLGHRNLPAASTITEILRRNDLLKLSSAESKPNWQRFEHEKPNDLWQIDFKGPLSIRQEQCHALTVLDDHSRFSLGVKITKRQSYEETRFHLSDIFRRYGLPDAMTMDNGTPWGNPYGRWTRFTLWLLDLDIAVSHSRPRHPQTQGKDERFHRTLKDELLNRNEFSDLAHLQRKCDEWRIQYNQLRPHCALNLDVPAAHYEISRREFKEQVPEYEYSSEHAVRIVNPNGRVKFKGKAYTVGEVFGQLKVGIRPTIEDGVYAVFYRHKQVGNIQLE